MVSQNRPPPMPVPVQVPQGQVMQQYVNESGTLTHVVLSPTQYQQLHTGQGGVPHIHAPFITTNGTTSHYYSPLAAGYTPGPAGNPHFHPMSSGHLQPQQLSHSPHSPSPPSNYHKDERTQRQHTKLLRKLDQKREQNSAMSTPAHSPSPRKNDLNGLRRTSRNGASSVGTSEDGEESSSVPDDEDDCQTIIEQLSNVQKPEVTDITSRSATLRWEAPPVSENLVNCRDLRYIVLLSDRAKEGKYKLIFKGESYVCMIRDLRPGQEYLVRLQVHYEKLQGSASEATSFITPPCEPDQPLPPKLIHRTKNTLHLRWSSPHHNGSSIVQYILEYDEGKGKEFIEAAKTKGKQCTLVKLLPSTLYSFRLSAVNECGPSIYSEVVAYCTTGNPPLIPRPPILQAVTSNSLRVAWERRSRDEKFTLQMADRDSHTPFFDMYCGLETAYECRGLRRATAYLFRLRADNESGPSPWSSEVLYKTHPERPDRPSKPQVIGKIQGDFFRARWDPPLDRGGAEIRKYILEIRSGAKFERIYAGNEPEAICDRLSPGTTYQIRVACEGPGGVSSYSDVSTVTTEAILPGAPEPPFCENIPGPYSAVLRWERPDYNGGAPVLEYEVQLNGPDRHDDLIYRGKETTCVAQDLSPGEDYEANVRAVNRIGAGEWSKALKFSSGVAPPSAPDAPAVIVRSSNQLTVSWNEPLANGSPILEYRLESSLTNESSDSFNTNYQGIQTSADVRNLVPYTLYYFRVNASNLAGCSEYSPIVSTKTPAAVPGIPQIKSSEFTATEVTLKWSEPECNGADILYYCIEFGDRSIATETNCTEYTITGLASETSYKFKIQAVNKIGAGQFSNPLKLTTLPPPPKPPRLECTGVGHNFIKLKWGDGKNLDFTKYYVEMYISRAREFQQVYTGTNMMCKINKLQEQTAYNFRICAGNDRAGIGDYSEECTFSTSATLPSSIKVPRVVIGEHASSSSIVAASGAVVVSGSHSLTTGITGIPSQMGHLHYRVGVPVTVEWQHSKNTFNDPIEYILECAGAKDGVFHEIYRGPDTKHTIDTLEPGSVYLFRVCPVRVTPSNGDLVGQFTSPLRYQVPQRISIGSIDAAALAGNLGANHHHHNNNINHNTLLSSTHISHQNRRSSSSRSNSATGGAVSAVTTLNTTDLVNFVNYEDQRSGVGGGIGIMGVGGGVVGGVGTVGTVGGASSVLLNANAAVNLGAIRRLTGKLTAIYSNRKRFTDQEKATIYMLSFLIITICFAALVKMFMR